MQKPGCGYPTTHLLLLTGPGGVAMEAICSPLRTGDMTHASKIRTRSFRPGDLLMGDRLVRRVGPSAPAASQQLDGLFPAHHSRTIGWGARAEHGTEPPLRAVLGWYDQLVEYRKPQKRPKWMSQRAVYGGSPVDPGAGDPPPGVGRRACGRLVTLVTTLTDHRKYPAKELAQAAGPALGDRGGPAVAEDDMGMEQLRCLSVEGVKKELLMYLIVYNLVRLLMLEAAAAQACRWLASASPMRCAWLRHGSGGD